MREEILIGEPYFPEVLQEKNRTVLPIFKCFTSSLGGVLRSIGYGAELDLMLCRNLCFYWSCSDLGVLFGCDIHPILEDLNDIDNVGITLVPQGDGDTALKKIKADLLRGIPQVVNVDEYYVPCYMGYRKVHNFHTSLLVGLGEQSIYLNDLGTVNRIQIDDFLSSIAPTNFSLYEYHLPPKKLIYSEEVLLTLISRNISYGMLETKLTVRGKECLSGIKGIRELASDLASPPSNQKLRSPEILARLGTKSYDILVQRYWHQAFLHAIRLINGPNDLLTKGTELLKDIVRDWQIIKNMFHKASVLKSDEIVQRISRKLINVADVEAEFFSTCNRFLEAGNGTEKT